MDMPKHIRGRATPRRAEIPRPMRVSLWRAPATSGRLPDLPSPKRSSGFAQAGATGSRRAAFLAGRRAKAETELARISPKGL